MKAQHFEGMISILGNHSRDHTEKDDPTWQVLNNDNCHGHIELCAVLCIPHELLRISVFIMNDARLRTQGSGKVKKSHSPSFFFIASSVNDLHSFIVLRSHLSLWLSE